MTCETGERKQEKGDGEERQKGGEGEGGRRIQERDSGRRARKRLRLGESTRVCESDSESKRARESERKSE